MDLAHRFAFLIFLEFSNENDTRTIDETRNKNVIVDSCLIQGLPLKIKALSMECAAAMAEDSKK